MQNLLLTQLCLLLSSGVLICHASLVRAIVMSSSKNGVQGKIAAQYPNATYVHCHSHFLNLAISSGCTAVTSIHNLFDNVNKLTWFLSGSAKRKDRTWCRG